MTMTNAERQARYRARQAGRRNVTPEDAIAAQCRALAADFVRDVLDQAPYRDEEDVAVSVALVRDVTGRPPWPEGQFASWLEGILVREIEVQISEAHRAQRKRRRRA
jgi:hypothetical protein